MKALTITPGGLSDKLPTRTPIYEQVLSDNSYGFRPDRSAHDAIKRTTGFYNQKYHYVVVLDLKAYFDTVNHDLLMNFIEHSL